MPHEALAEALPRREAARIHEEAVRFGEGGRLVGILTLPADVRPTVEPLPVFVFLNAGLLHRVGPRRLHVDLARRLAHLGFPSIRVDQSGIGDSPMQVGMSGTDQAAADFREIAKVLQAHVGRRPLVVGGLCAGADSAIFMTIQEEAPVVGMFLLDPVCYPDRWFRARSLLRLAGEIATHPVFHARLFIHRVGLVLQGQRRVDQLALRDVPTRDETRRAFDAVRAQGGKVFSLFTRYSLITYNRHGQFRDALGVDGYDDFATELFWPSVNHVFPTDLHRTRLMDKIETWARGFIRSE